MPGTRPGTRPGMTDADDQSKPDGRRSHVSVVMPGSAAQAAGGGRLDQDRRDAERDRNRAGNREKLEPHGFASLRRPLTARPGTPPNACGSARTRKFLKNLTP